MQIVIDLQSWTEGPALPGTVGIALNVVASQWRCWMCNSEDWLIGHPMKFTIHTPVTFINVEISESMLCTLQVSHRKDSAVNASPERQYCECSNTMP